MLFKSFRKHLKKYLAHFYNTSPLIGILKALSKKNFTFAPTQTYIGIISKTNEKLSILLMWAFIVGSTCFGITLLAQLPFFESVKLSAITQVWWWILLTNTIRPHSQN